MPAHARRLLVSTLFAACTWTAGARAECHRLAPWNRVGQSLGHLTEPLPLVLVAASPLPLVALGPTGGDHDLRVLAQRHLGGAYRLEPVSYFTPYLFAAGALAAFGVSAAYEACALERPLAAMLQAMTGGVIATGLLKWSVGREWPNGGRNPRAPDRLSHAEYATTYHPFRPTFGAWPSGHTLSMFAAASAFRAAEVELGWVRFLGYPVAAGVAAGMWFGDRHWASDILSGALIGEAIGSSAGQSFAPSEDPATALARGTLVAIPVERGMLLAWNAIW